MSNANWWLHGEDHAPNCWLVTTAIGGEYFAEWKRNVSSNWIRYADRHGIGIAVATNNLWQGSEPQLNGAWQKLLTLRSLAQKLGRNIRCAVIDTDVLINPGAVDIFTAVNAGNVGVVSQVREIPMPLDRLNNRIAFLRRSFMDSSFPLESLLNAKPKQLFEWAGLSPTFDDFFCSGVMIADTETHASVFEKWYGEAPDSGYQSLGGWEQTYVNHRVQQLAELEWLEYSWQALWIFEVAAYYPFLYSRECPQEVVSWCLSSSLMRNNFLHLAGRWESGLLSGPNLVFPGVQSGAADFFELLANHERQEFAAKVLGKIMPQ